MKFLRGPLAADGQTGNGLASLPQEGMASPSSFVFTAAAGWWTDSIEVVVSATIWMLPELLRKSFFANETLVIRSRVLYLVRCARSQRGGSGRHSLL